MPRCPCLRSGLILRCALLLRGSGQRKSRAGLRVPGMFLSCPGGSLGSEFYLAISQFRLCFRCSLFGETPGRACRVPGTLPAALVATRLGLWSLQLERRCVRVRVRLYSAATPVRQPHGHALSIVGTVDVNSSDAELLILLKTIKNHPSCWSF